MKFLAVFVIAVGLFGDTLAKDISFVSGKFTDIDSISQLDSMTVFSFCIFGDNKGHSPATSESFGRMIDWTSHAFISIGLGGHLQKGEPNSFLPFLSKNQRWTENFYPNISNIENEFYDNLKIENCPGAELFNLVDLPSRSNIVFSSTGCDYYSKIYAPKGFTVHLIQLYSPDKTHGPSYTSMEFVEETMSTVEKNGKDIFILGAYYLTMDDVLSIPAEILDIFDLIVSAGTLMFERFEHPDRKSSPLILNIGAIPHSIAYCPPGYVDVLVLDNPAGLFVQYTNADVPIREFQHESYAFFIDTGGEIHRTSLRNKRITESHDRVICYIDSSFSKEAMTAIAESLYIAKTNADIAIIDSAHGIEGREICYRKLWRVFPFNNEIWVLILAPEEFIMMFNREPVGDGTLRVATSSHIGSQIAEKFDLDSGKIERTGINELGLLTEWIYSISQ